MVADDRAADHAARSPDVRGPSSVVGREETTTGNGPRTTDSPGTDDGAPFTWSGLLLRFFQRSLILFILYALSIGPLYWEWYGARFAGGSIIFAAFYEPLVVLAELVPPFGEWMDWYVGLWIT